MYLFFGSGLQGQATSFWPADKGIPTECRHFVNSPSPSASMALSPIRVMIFILTATYGESDNCTPNCEMGDPNGPIQNGMTYIVRPFIAPSNFGFKRAFISAGAIQLLVGPASPLFFEQI